MVQIIAIFAHTCMACAVSFKFSIIYLRAVLISQIICDITDVQYNSNKPSAQLELLVFEPIKFD